MLTLCKHNYACITEVIFFRDCDFEYFDYIDAFENGYFCKNLEEMFSR